MTFYQCLPPFTPRTKFCKLYTISVQLYTTLRQNVFNKMDLQYTMTSSAFPCPFCPIKGSVVSTQYVINEYSLTP